MKVQNDKFLNNDTGEEISVKDLLGFTIVDFVFGDKIIMLVEYQG
ncbi:MAG: hypothetical protein ACOCP4_07385 [Candidatus Woesearchaeota archaeon]